MTPLVIDRRHCYYPFCNKPAEQWHHVWPRCITKQRSSDLRGAVPTCIKHHAIATADSTLVQSTQACWESTKSGQKLLQRMVVLYAKGGTAKSLAKKFGNVSCHSIIAAFRRNGIYVRGRGESQRKFLPEQVAQICKEYDEGLNTYQLAQKYRAAQCTICNTIKRNGRKLRSGTQAALMRGNNGSANNNVKLTAKQVRQIRSIKEWKRGDTRQWATKFGVTMTTIGDVIRRKT